MAKFDLKKLNSANSYKISFLNTDNINGARVKEIRNNLGVSQNVFGTILGVTKKTIEKWEQGKNPVTGTSATLLALIEQNPNIVPLLFTTASPKTSIGIADEDLKKSSDEYSAPFCSSTAWEEKDDSSKKRSAFDQPILQG